MDTLADWINVVGAGMTIALGLVGWLAPRYTMRKLDLKTDGASTMGISEVRAASGALFVGLGVGAFLLGAPEGFAMVGFALVGASVGRITSILLDSNSPGTAWWFFAWEIVTGGLLLWLNVI